jgi:HME family heavy-metal exporter
MEKQVLAPQIKVRVDYDAAAQYGVPAPQVLADRCSAGRGRKVTQVVEGSRRFAWWCACPSQRARPRAWPAC